MKPNQTENVLFFKQMTVIHKKKKAFLYDFYLYWKLSNKYLHQDLVLIWNLKANL